MMCPPRIERRRRRSLQYHFVSLDGSLIIGLLNDWANQAKVAETEEDLEGFEDEDETDIDIPVEIVGEG